MEDVTGGRQGLGGGRGVLEQGRMCQHLACQIVSDDQPALQAEGELGGMDGSERPQPGEARGCVGLEGGVEDHSAALVRALLVRAHGVSRSRPPDGARTGRPDNTTGRRWCRGRREDGPMPLRVRPVAPRTNMPGGMHAVHALPGPENSVAAAEVGRPHGGQAENGRSRLRVGETVGLGVPPRAPTCWRHRPQDTAPAPPRLTRRRAYGRWCHPGPAGARPRTVLPGGAGAVPVGGRPAPSAARRGRRSSARPTAAAPR